MRKKILTLFSIFILFLTPNIVKAASANVQISAPSSVYVGEKVTVSVTVSSSASLGSWQYTIAYDDSILGDCSDSQTVVSWSDNAGKTSVTNTWSFTAKGSGSASFSIPSIVVYSFDDESKMSIGGSTSTSINVVSPSRPSGGNGGSNGGGNSGHTDYKYSDDNNLSSLVIEGFNIDFDSSITDYSVTVPNDTKKVKVGATANDGNASVSGIGDYDVKEGNNEISIVVTAENGDTKTYKVNVVVKELSPIEVKVNDKTYSVIRKSDKLPKVNATYKASTILIKGESVPCYHSEITDIYLVGLMNDKGKVELFNYDSKNDKFNVYNEINVGGLYISLIENADAPIGYKSGLVKIGDKEYNGYLKDGSYSLLYGINLETGEKNFYSYDSSEGTLQKFVSSSKVNSKFYSYILFGLIGLCVFEFIMIIVCVVSKNKKLKKFLHQLNVGDISENESSTVSLDESNYSQEVDDQSEADSVDIEHDDQSQLDEEVNMDNDYPQDSFEETSEDVEDKSDVSFDTEEIEEGLGHTALISRSVTNVYNNTKNRKESIKERKSLRKKNKKNKDEDDMFKF